MFGIKPKLMKCRFVLTYFYATFDLDPKLHNNSLPLCIFETNEDFSWIFGGRMYQGTNVCHMKHSDTRGQVSII
jgi:hypothetical protein